MPRADESSSVLSEGSTVLSPLSTVVYSFPKASVGQAARVHASDGPATRVWPESVNDPPQVLQSTRVDKRPLAKVSV
jgi:hypothetical protein